MASRAYFLLATLCLATFINTHALTATWTKQILDDPDGTLAYAVYAEGQFVVQSFNNQNAVVDLHFSTDGMNWNVEGLCFEGFQALYNLYYDFDSQIFIGWGPNSVGFGSDINNLKYRAHDVRGLGGVAFFEGTWALVGIEECFATRDYSQTRMDIRTGDSISTITEVFNSTCTEGYAASTIVHSIKDRVWATYDYSTQAIWQSTNDDASSWEMGFEIPCQSPGNYETLFPQVVSANGQLFFMCQANQVVYAMRFCHQWDMVMYGLNVADIKWFPALNMYVATTNEGLYQSNDGFNWNLWMTVPFVDSQIAASDQPDEDGNVILVGLGRNMDVYTAKVPMQ